MKQVTSNFKNTLKKMGKEIKSTITYGDTILVDELYSVTPHYEANILKSAMKQLDVETSVDIELGTVINYTFGLLVNGTYENIDFGNYVVYSSEKQEDTNRYKIVCYDKMLYAMKEYEPLQVTYPITVKNYLSALATKIGLTLASGTFYNESLTIPTDIYEDLGYTYRDILDEIAQATGSIICISNNDEIQVRYPNVTSDIIDEEYLKDINVKFGEMYGPINSIVLSRSAESDNVYLRDDQSIEDNGLCEIKIVDNQIMNFNDRSGFLPGLLSALDGLYYYKNDFKSIGILYYEIGDLYNVSIGENIYQCLMLNDEVDVTSGIEELIYTDLPEQSETDYTKSDKTDQRINQTYLIVDKQNQTIESVVSNVTTQNNKIARIEQTVDELNSKISDIADITVSKETDTGSLTFDNINASNPIYINIKPLAENISYLYPFNTLTPANNLYIKLRTLRFINTDTSEVFDWELPDDLLYYDSNNYDELVLDYEAQEVHINKKCKYNTSTGAVELLANERTDIYTFPSIPLTDGDYTVQMLKYDNTPYNCYLFVRLMSQNIYTTQFYTKAETDTIISQTADSIDLSVDTKLSNYSTTTEMNTAISLSQTGILSTVSSTYATKTELNTAKSEIQQTTDSISATVSNNNTKANIVAKINDNTSSVKISADNVELSGYVTINGLSGGTTTVSGNCLTTGTINASLCNITNINASSITTGTISANKISGGSLNLTGTNTTINSSNFSVSSNGDVTCSNLTATGGTIGGFTISSDHMEATQGNYYVSLANASNANNDFLVVRTGTSGNYDYPFYVRGNGLLHATNAEITGTISGSTITGSTIRGNTITGGTISGSTISGVTISSGSFSGASVSAQSVYGDSVGLNTIYEHFYAGSRQGQTTTLAIQTNNGIKVCQFTGGILTAVVDT